MRKTLIQCLTLLFAPVLTLLLFTTAALATEGGGTSPNITIYPAGPMEPRSTATFSLNNPPADAAVVTWESSDPAVVAVATMTGTATAGTKAGEATITAYNGETKLATLLVQVSGVAAVKDSIEVEENGDPVSLTGNIKTYGAAITRGITFTSRDTYIAEIVNDTQVRGLQVGEATIEASANDGRYRTTFTVTVTPNSTTEIKLNRTIKSGEVLKFSDLTSNFAGQVNGEVEYVTGLFVPTDQGTLYYEYNSDSEPGAGVGQIESYYRSPGPGQRALSKVTFVPKSSFLGGTVTITYNAVTRAGKTYSCKITFTVQGSSSGDGVQPGVTSTRTSYNTALQLDSTELGAVCRERLGVQLDYVIFSQPPEREGTLYTNYSSSGSYGSVVDVHRQYSRKDIDNIWFVPAPGYRGEVTVYYTGFGTNSKSYNGQIIIQVGQENSTAAAGGLLAYDVAPGGVARFDDWDFDNYCAQLLDDEQTLSAIRFESLPSEREGVLYYDYQTASNTGSRAEVGTVYYYGTRAPRIDRLVFVPAEDFIGGLKLPFTGWTMDGTSFSGNVEINVRSGSVSGDIYYYCAPGRSVSFRSSDFTSLSNTMTGRTLNYIRLQNLPSTGTLYYGSSRASTGTRYTNSNLSRLTFRAPNSFSGPVNISFEGVSTGGDTFYGVITIGTSGSGSGRSGSIQYTTDSQTAAVFYRDDFDDLSLWETDRYISSVRFTPPSSSQGSLYRNYRSSANMGTQITSATSISASDLDRVAFVPATGYTGTVYIGFTATASGSGGTFTGEVAVTVTSSGSVSSNYVSYSDGYSYFSDMTGYSNTQQTAVNYLYEQGIVNGFGDGRYGPESSIRRGDFALMVYDAFDLNTDVSDGPFVDVSSGAYYADAVNALYARGIVSGVGDGRYAPDSTLTRQDAVCMVQRAMRAVGRDAADGSADALGRYNDGGSVSGYAQGAMALIVQRGYLPTADGLLNPQQPLTRVDMADILYRVLTYSN